MPSTINYQAGDLVLVDFPFTVGGSGKLRPALVMLDSGDAGRATRSGYYSAEEQPI